jgi:hypothetical protein
LLGNSKGLEDSLESSEKKTFNLGETIKKLAIGGAVVAGVKAGFDFLKGSVAAATEEQAGIALLGQAVRNTGADWDTASAAIETYLAAELRRTALDDGAGRAAIQKLTETTGDYQTALDLMGLTQDVAAAKGIDLSTAAELVGRVHEGNTGMLTRYGIVLGEGATATEALGAMQAKFGGAAEAYGNTNQGAADKLSTSWGNLKETIGGALLPVIATFTTYLANLAMNALPWVENAIGTVAPFFERLWGLVQAGIAWLQQLLGGLGNAGGALGGMGAVIERLGTLWDVIWSRMQVIFAPIIEDMQRLLRNIAADAQTFFLDKFQFIKDWFLANMPLIQDVVDHVMQRIRTILTGIGKFWEEHGVAVMGYVSQMWENIKTAIGLAINVVLGVIKAVMQLITGDWEGAWETIKGVLVEIWDSIKKIVGDTIEAILRVFGTNSDALLAAIKKPFQDAWDWLTGTWSKIKDFVAGIFDGVKIKMPHFSIKWQEVFGVNIPVGMDVQWYGSGLDAVFNQPTLIGVGESGPERVQVTPSGQGGGSGGGGIHIVYNDHRTGGESNIERVARGLEWQLRMAGA